MDKMWHNHPPFYQTFLSICTTRFRYVIKWNTINIDSVLHKLSLTGRRSLTYFIAHKKAPDRFGKRSGTLTINSIMPGFCFPGWKKVT